MCMYVIAQTTLTTGIFFLAIANNDTINSGGSQRKEVVTGSFDKRLFLTLRPHAHKKALPGDHVPLSNAFTPLSVVRGVGNAKHTHHLHQF